MSQTHRVTRTWSLASGQQLTATESIACSGGIDVDETIPANSTDLLVALTLDVSQLKVLYMLATADMTLETNSSSSPVHTITLKAGVPRVWTSTDGSTSPVANTDVTALYVTSTAGGTLKIRAGYDATV